MNRTEQLDAIHRELDATETRARTLAGQAGDSRWALRPSAHAWSVSECVQHLVLTADRVLPLLDAALDPQTPTTPVRGPYRRSLFGRLFAWSLEPPYRIRFTTSAPFVPAAARPAEVDLDDLHQRHVALHAHIARADRWPLDRIRIQSPFDRRLRYSVFTALHVLAAHERRHLWQAEQTLAALAASHAREV